MSKRMMQPVACERRWLEHIAKRLQDFKGCANPERLTLVLARIEWLLEANESDSVLLTFAQLQKRLFQWLTVKQVEHAVYQLRDLGLLSAVRQDHAVRYAIPEVGESQSRSGGIVNPEVGDSHLVLENFNENLNDHMSEKPKSRQQITAKELPDLAEIERDIPAGWLPQWQIWRDTVWPLKNKSGKVGVEPTKVALYNLLQAQVEEKLSDKAMRHGFSVSTEKGAPNVNFVLQCARNFRESVSSTPISNGKAPMGSIAAMWENRGGKA